MTLIVVYVCVFVCVCVCVCVGVGSGLLLQNLLHANYMYAENTVLYM